MGQLSAAKQKLNIVGSLFGGPVWGGTFILEYGKKNPCPILVFLGARQ